MTGHECQEVVLLDWTRDGDSKRFTGDDEYKRAGL